jgi:hypothetical protein
MGGSLPPGGLQPGSRPEREQQRDGVVDMSPDSGLQTSFELVLEYKITM